MAHYETIETNPNALRHIASDIRSYTECQLSTIQDFLTIISSVEEDITTDSFTESIERVRFWVRQMEELKQQSDVFAAYLWERAEKIEAMERHH